MMVSLEKRLGFLIGIKRRKKLLLGDIAFKQENFIKVTKKHPFTGCATGSVVCSLATLSRLENGKHDLNHALLDFFLIKLDSRYKIKESVHEEEENLLKQINHSITLKPAETFWLQLDDLVQFYAHYENDILIMSDAKAINFIRRVFRNTVVSREEYEEIAIMMNVCHPIIKRLFLGCGMWLKQIHPDFWTLIDDPKSVYFIEIGKTIQIKRNLEKLGIDDASGSLLHQVHPQSLASFKLEKLMRLQHRPLTIHHDFIITESELCLSILMQHPLLTEGNSKLYIALSQWLLLQDPQTKLDDLENEITTMLIHEPHPKPITKALSILIVKLCQTSKTYKPLVTILSLYHGNSVQ